MEIIYLTVFFLLGLIIGSFLNVVIIRYNTEKNLGGRSACMSCQKKLCWYELIPVFSFFMLRGRCMSCKTKISMQYPLVELATGVLFALLYLKFAHLFFVSPIMFAMSFGYYASIFALLIIITVYDIKHKIIPDPLVVVLSVFSFLGVFFFSPYGFFVHIPYVLDIFSGVIVALVFGLMWLVSSGRWIGLGDAKLVIPLGFFLGFSGLLSAVVLAFWFGAIIGLALLFGSKAYGWKSEIPFAPFLVLGSALVFLFNIIIFPVF